MDADLCVITTIGLDHTEILGDTREQIARAKAGIHREGVPMVVYHPGEESVLETIAEVAGDDLYVHKGIEIDNHWENWFIFAGYIATSFGWELPSENINWPGRSPNWPPKDLFKSNIRISAAHNADGLQSELMSIRRTHNSSHRSYSKGQFGRGLSRCNKRTLAYANIPSHHRYRTNNWKKSSG